MCDVKDPENFVICRKAFQVYKVVSRPVSQKTPPGVFYSQYTPPERSPIEGRNNERGAWYKYRLDTLSDSEFPGLFFYRDREMALEVYGPNLGEYVLECVVPRGAKLWRSDITGEITSSSTLRPVRVVESDN